MYTQCVDSVSATVRGARVRRDAQKKGAGERATTGAHPPRAAVGWTQSANGQLSWPASPRTVLHDIVATVARCPRYVESQQDGCRARDVGRACRRVRNVVAMQHD